MSPVRYEEQVVSLRSAAFYAARLLPPLGLKLTKAEGGGLSNITDDHVSLCIYIYIM